jgi:hypothetical protein
LQGEESKGKDSGLRYTFLFFEDVVGVTEALLSSLISLKTTVFLGDLLLLLGWLDRALIPD